MVEKSKLSIIIPAYNEEKSIGKVISDLKDLGDDYEIIVIDDASEDNTYRIASETAAKVLRHPFNKGYGASLKTGLLSAQGDVICFFDSDGQHQASDLEELTKYIGEYDAVFGMRTSKSHTPFFRRPGKKIISLVANYLSNYRIPDLNCGLRAIKKEVIMRIMHILPDGFSFSTTTTLALYKSGYNVKWVPVTVLRRIGKSTVRQVRHGMETLLLIVRVITLFDPLKVFLPASIVISGIGVLWGVYGIIRMFKVLNAAVLMIVTGIFVFFFGILSDQIASMRREKK